MKCRIAVALATFLASGFLFAEESQKTCCCVEGLTDVRCVVNSDGALFTQGRRDDGVPAVASGTPADVGGCMAVSFRTQYVTVTEGKKARVAVPVTCPDLLKKENFEMSSGANISAKLGSPLLLTVEIPYGFTDGLARRDRRAGVFYHPEGRADDPLLVAVLKVRPPRHASSDLGF